MLQKINLTPTHISFKLNRHIYYHLLKIKDISKTASFDPYNKYFSQLLLNKVSRSSKLREKFKIFFDAFKELDLSQRNNVIEKFKSAQKVHEILDDRTYNGSLIKLLALPNTLQEPTKDLFVYLYEKTLSNDKKNHYELIYSQIKSKVCPFCGLEKINNPDMYNQDYDHILYKNDYPFIAVNMRNLIPMGRDCNQIYKRAKDVLYDNRGIRRLFLYPYHYSKSIQFSLTGSQLPKGGTDKGKWNIQIIPDDEYTRTWDDVFCIKERCVKNELEAFFDQWLSLFKSYLKPKGIHWTEPLVRNEMQITGNAYLSTPLDTSNIIRGSLFLFLYTCNDQDFFNALVRELNS